MALSSNCETRHAWGWTSTSADDSTTALRLFFFPRTFRLAGSRLRRRLNAVTCHSTLFVLWVLWRPAKWKTDGRGIRAINRMCQHQTFLISILLRPIYQSSIPLFIIFGMRTSDGDGLIEFQPNENASVLGKNRYSKSWLVIYIWAFTAIHIHDTGPSSTASTATMSYICRCSISVAV